MSLAPGSRLSRYELTSLLGEGGMGRVFLMRDSKLGAEGHHFLVMKLVEGETAPEILAPVLAREPGFATTTVVK